MVRNNAVSSPNTNITEERYFSYRASNMDSISLLGKIEDGLDWALYLTLVVGVLLLVLKPEYLIGTLASPIVGLVAFGVLN